LNYSTWVAQSKGKIVGGLIMTFEENCAEISNIAVHPFVQGVGLGRGLLGFGEQQARGKEHIRMRLATHVLLKENVSLYQHLGWEVVNRDSVRITMGKQIS
jgi:N-acetylglutamate synthase-like GNAT family acetyltransferase